MAVNSKNNSPPVSADARRRRRRTRAKVGRTKTGKSRKFAIATKIKTSSKRCLNAASLAESRLEILSMLDFKPLNALREPTLAGQMFDLRINERNADLESVIQALTNARENNEEAFDKAINSYNSALVATESEFALLKLLILLQKYSTHTTRFLPFIDEYEAPDNLQLDFLGDSGREILKAATSVKFNTMINDDLATLILVQVLAMLNCSNIGISPYHLSKRSLNLTSGKNVFVRLDGKDYSLQRALYDVAYLSRDLTFSREMTRIRDDQEPNEEYKQLIEDVFGSSFATSSRTVTTDIMSKIIGTNAFSNMRTSLSRQTEVKTIEVDKLFGASSGVLPALRYNKKILLPETTEVTYKKGYDSIEPIIDNAFSGKKVLDFSEYSDVVNNLIDSIRLAVDFGKTSFRLMEAASDSDGASLSLPIVAEEQPLSMPSVAATVLDVFNRRFASTLKTSLYNKFYDWLTPEHVSYTRIFAWMLIRDNPDLAKRIIDGFMDDYERGYLTASALPEPIEGTAEIDEETGEEIEGTEQLSELSYVLPNTNTTVNLTGKSSRLISRIRKLNDYFENDLLQMSPAAMVSENEGEGLSFPQIRTNYDRQETELGDYFGSPNPSKSDPDLRLINVMHMYQKYITFFDLEDGAEGASTKETHFYLSTKIVAAEVIDAVLEVMRMFVTPFAEVEPVEDGEPIFPFVDQMKGPYGVDKSTWGYSGAGYEQFNMNLWVPTATEWNSVFTRSVDKTTYFRRSSFRACANRVIEMFEFLMQQYKFIQPRMETITSGHIIKPVAVNRAKHWIPVTATIKFVPTAVRKSGWQADGNENISEHLGTLSSIITDLLEANFEDFEDSVEDIKASLPDGAVTTTSVERRATTTVSAAPAPPPPPGSSWPAPPPPPHPSSVDAPPPPPGPVTYEVVEVDSSTYSPRVPPAQTALDSWSNILKASKREDLILSFYYDFIDQYATRVENYMSATMDLVEGEGAPLGELINNLRDAGEAGTDVLQNMSVNQLALKQIAIEEESADVDNGYLPRLSILNDSEIAAVKVLCEEEILKSPEGDTTRVIMVGIPIGSFDRNKIDSEFCLRLSYRDIEYPQLVFRSKSFKFDKDLYVLPTDLEAADKNSTDFNDIVESMNFTKLRVEVIESNDSSAEITLEDDKETLSVDNSNKSIYVNLAASEVLKLYYRIMLGLNFSEVAFLSTPEGLSIPISPSMSSLAQSMAANVESMSSYSEGLASNVTGLLNDITKLDDPEDFVSGEISQVDAALLGDLKNAYQSRLFSPDLLRTRSMSAKMFDRIYALPVDPDEFYIVAPGEAQVGDVETPEEIFDFYLKSGIIEETGQSSPFAYKLAPRKSAEGSMAMGSVTVAMTTVDDSAEEILGL